MLHIVSWPGKLSHTRNMRLGVFVLGFFLLSVFFSSSSSSSLFVDAQPQHDAIDTTDAQQIATTTETVQEQQQQQQQQQQLEQLDHEATVVITLEIDVDGTEYILTVQPGQLVRVAAETFCFERGLDAAVFVPPLEKALIEEADRIFEENRSGSSAETSSSSSISPDGTSSTSTSTTTSTTTSSTTTTTNIVATIDVTLNGETFPCEMKQGEGPVEAAVRFSAAHGLATDEEYDGVLRILVNRLRAATGSIDGLPFTSEETRTRVVIDVNTGDGTGRILKLRVLEGETPAEAARGFLERTGFGNHNIEPLTRMAEAKLAQLQQQQQAAEGDGEGATSTESTKGSKNSRGAVSSIPDLISPTDGVTVVIEFEDGKSKLPLVYRYTEDPNESAASFLRATGFGDHEQFGSFVESIAAGIRARVVYVQEALLKRSSSVVGTGRVAPTPSSSSSSSQQQQQQQQQREPTVEEEAAFASATADARTRNPSSSSSSPSFSQQQQQRDDYDDTPIISPISATVPLSLGELAIDLVVKKGDNIRAIARSLCVSSWEEISPALDLALAGATVSVASSSSSSSSSTQSSLKATQAMCTAVVYDVCATFLAALAEEEEHALLRQSNGGSGSGDSGSQSSSMPSSISEPAVIREAAKFVTKLTEPEPEKQK